MKYYIYKIYHKDNNDDNLYIGSTNDYKRRKRQHKKDCYKKNQKSYNRPIYQYIRKLGGFDNFIFEVIEELDCTKEELLLREKELINQFKATINIISPIIK